MIKQAVRIQLQYLLLFAALLGFKNSYAAEYSWPVSRAQQGLPDIHFPTPEEACLFLAGAFPLHSVVPVLNGAPGDFFCSRVLDNPPGFIQGVGTVRRVGTSCPNQNTFYNPLTGICEGSSLSKNSGNPSCSGVGNPINISTGNKYQRESDYVGNGRFRLQVNRSYNSDSGEWRFLPQIISGGNREGLIEARVVRGDGQALPFTSANSLTLAANTFASTPDVIGKLVGFTDGIGAVVSWRYTTADQEIETYDGAGFLTSVTNREGVSHTYEYLGNTGIRVTHSDGQQLSYTLSDNLRIIAFTTPDNQQYNYGYDPQNRLTTVTYPDNTPLDGTDNLQRRYHYEDINFPNVLTGITDETNQRFATWAYDAQGRAVSSEHAGGVEKFTVDYSYIDDATDPRITVTNPLNKQTTYHFETINGRRLTTLIEGHATATCPEVDRSNTYDENGFRDLAVDWNGILTDFDHDERGLEIQRIEAVGTPEQRIITTAWHPDFRLPTEITEPNKTTTFTYDTNGNLLSRTETDTGATP